MPSPLSEPLPLAIHQCLVMRWSAGSQKQTSPQPNQRAQPNNNAHKEEQASVSPPPPHSPPLPHCYTQWREGGRERQIINNSIKRNLYLNLYIYLYSLIELSHIIARLSTFCFQRKRTCELLVHLPWMTHQLTTHSSTLIENCRVHWPVDLDANSVRP